MDTFEILPQKWYKWTFDIIQNASAVATIDIKSFKEKARVIISGEEFTMFREGLLRGAFILEARGTELARAVKPSAMKRRFELSFAGRSYVLESTSALGREFHLLHGDEPVGSIKPRGMVTRKADATMAEDLPTAVQIFVVSLVLFMWKRQSDAAAGG